MYLENIEIENYGAIEKLSYTMPFNENGNPQPVVLIGKNGVGKTLLLSNIIHALIEQKRKVYDNIPEVSENKYYRLGSKAYIREGANHSYIYYNFTNNNYYVDLMLNDYDKFKTKEYKVETYKNIDIASEKIKNDGFYSNSSKPGKEEFNNSIFLYFPADRYYCPKWLNKGNTNIKFNMEYENFVGQSNSDMIRDNVLEDIESWILDVIIDKMLYEGETVIHPIQKQNDNNYYFVEKHKYSGKNTNIHMYINEIVNKIFNNNTSRIGISKKAPRRISFMYRKADGTEDEFIPDFKNVSSGEMMTLAMFCAILKECDRVLGNKSIDIKDIEGIVLIDEIDLHLHSDFAKEVLPSIITYFPKIQFIVSSHSPFFLLGMNQIFDSECKFLSLPDGVIMNNIESFDEIQKCYDMLDKSYNDIVKKLEAYEEKLKVIDKPLIITEGKTDWKHIKNALNMFKERGEFLDLDILIEEYEYDMGEKTLETLLNNLAKLDQTHRIIGIFDNDSSVGKKYLTIKDFGKNVFGCCIPSSSEYKCGISIEMLYKRSEMLREDENGRRLYLSDEFNQKNNRLKNNKNINTNNLNAVKEFYKFGIVKIIDSEVFDESEQSIALSKEDFAEKVLAREGAFANMNVDNFRGIFETIEEILKK